MREEGAEEVAEEETEAGFLFEQFDFGIEHRFLSPGSCVCCKVSLLNASKENFQVVAFQNLATDKIEDDQLGNTSMCAEYLELNSLANT